MLQQCSSLDAMLCHPKRRSICSTLNRKLRTISLIRLSFSNSASSSSICCKIALKRAICSSAICNALPARSYCCCVARSVASFSYSLLSEANLPFLCASGLPAPTSVRLPARSDRSAFPASASFLDQATAYPGCSPVSLLDFGLRHERAADAAAKSRYPAARVQVAYPGSTQAGRTTQAAAAVAVAAA